MSTYSQLNYHIVFGTKFRQKSITATVAPRLYEYIGGIIRRLKGIQLEIGGIEDHIHILLGIRPALAVADAFKEIKACSTKWVHEEFKTHDKFSWQVGYSAFTVSYSNVEAVKNYIQNQAEHHRERTFHEEYIELLKRHGIDYQEKHLFEGEHAG